MILKSQEREVPDGEGHGSIIAGVKTGLWNIAKNSMLADTGALLDDGGDLAREYNLEVGGGVVRKGGPRKKWKAEEEIETDSVGGKCACFNFGSVVRLRRVFD